MEQVPLYQFGTALQVEWEVLQVEAAVQAADVSSRGKLWGNKEFTTISKKGLIDGVDEMIGFRRADNRHRAGKSALP